MVLLMILCTDRNANYQKIVLQFVKLFFSQRKITITIAYYITVTVIKTAYQIQKMFRISA